MAWYNLFRPNAAEPSQPSGIKRIAAQSLAASLRTTPNGRVSKPAGGDWNELFGYLSGSFKGYPDQDTGEIIEVLRKAAQSDDDLAGSLRDMQGFVNPGFSWEFIAGSRASKQAEAELNRWAEHVYPGGLHVFINNQTREVYLSGASSAEWVPAPNRKAVSEVVVVTRETIQPVRDKETGRIVYEQQSLGGRVRLHPLTYRYQPIETEGEGFHGLPVAISAPATLARKTGIMTGVQKIINLMARSALVRALVPPATPEELGVQSTQDPEYAALLKEYYSEIADLLTSSAEMGLWVAPAGIDMQATPLTQNAAGVTDIMALNQRGHWNATATLPYLRGDTSANYALAKVMQPVLFSIANNIQLAIASQLQFGANLHLRLMGIPAQAFIKWHERPNVFALDDAQAEKARAETDAILIKHFGKAYARKMMLRHDITDEDFAAAPAWWDEVQTTEPDNPDPDLNGEEDDDET